MKGTYIVVDEQVLSDRLEELRQKYQFLSVCQFITSLSVALLGIAWWLK